MKSETYATVAILLASGTSFGVAAVGVLDGAGAIVLFPLTVAVTGLVAGVESFRYLLDEARYQGHREGFHKAIGRRAS